MSFDFSGFVLRAIRTAPSNFTTTDEASDGVDRDFKPLNSGVYTIPSPELVEIAADQYRTAVLLRTDDGQTEYLVWAANTANLSDIGDFTVSNKATVSFPTGNVPVENQNTIFASTTGSNRAIIIDDADRTVETVTSLVVLRGDTGDSFQLVGTGTFNPVSSVFTITDEATLLALGGGVSSARGDRATEIAYTLSGPAFWWSKNDRYENRFKWDGRVQRWKPLRGTPPRNLGRLLTETEYTLSPAPSRVPVGDFLPGDSADPDKFCSVRLGRRPDASSIPVAPPLAAGFTGIKVLTDAEVAEFDFSSDPTLAGVVGQETGTLVWNPAFVDEYAGQTIFYSYASFVDQEEIESLGFLENANLTLLFLAPIPGPTDYPFIRIGSRQPLQATLLDTETQLAGFVPQEGEVGVALSTGRLKFSDADLAKADPDDVEGFVPSYLGAQVFYDGVSLTQRPIPLRGPVQLVDNVGNPTTVNGKNHSIYVPDAVPTPSPGTSGILHNPDRTGTLPNTSVAPGIRPGGGSGLVREIEGPWDVVLFTESGQIRTIRTFDDDDERPRFRFRIPRGLAYLDLRLGAGGSEVILGNEDLKRFDGEAMFFLQSGIQPAAFCRESRMWSRVRDQFVLVGTEIFVFAVDGVVSLWNAALDPGGVATSAGGTFTAEEIAQSLDAVTDANVFAQGGRVAIETTGAVNGVHFGEIEIGFGPGGVKDLSGPSALGFLPGWCVRIASPTAVNPPPNVVWLPDNGTHVGIFRSPFNLNGSKEDVADINSVGRFDNVVFTSSISVSPVVLLDRPPLEDVAGYDENIFFRIQDGLVSFNLENYEEVFYEFGFEKFSWAAGFTQNTTVEQPTNNLFLGQGAVIPNSFRLPGKGLTVSVAGQPFEKQILGEDFLLPDNGDSGTAVLITTVGALKQLGGRGTFTAGSTTFTDPSSDIDFVALGVKAGWQLSITQGDAEGTYIVTADATLTNSLEVSPAFLASGGPVPWELYEGVTAEEFDPGVVADAQYVQFNHLPEDPWKIKVLSPLGDVPSNQTAQNLSRLMADLGAALASERQIFVRFGQASGSDEANMVALQRTNLGELVNSALNVPDTLSERFANNDFSIRVGQKTYIFTDGNLIKVPGALTFPLPGDVIEVQDVSGLLNFGAEVFVQFDGQDVIYVEEFLTPNTSPDELPSGKVEYRVEDGALNFSALDMMNRGGTEAYLVEWMNTTGGQDVTLNPIQGSFLFTTPLREFQVVETTYFRANNGTGTLFLEPVDPEDPEAGAQPVEVTEQVPLFVRLDPATPEGTGIVDMWRFNPTDRTVRQDIEPALYVGSTLYNVGSSPTATFNFNKNLALLALGVPDTSTVQVTYAVVEAFGGEQAYTVSQPPVYRPPFRIEADRTSFTLETDRTTDVSPGKLLRVAQFPFYITASIYNADSNLTFVEFRPGTQLEAGSRNPGSDSLSLLSDIPLATDITPDAPDGFWVTVSAPYEPVNRGFQSIIFQADLTAFLVAGHLLELGGDPFLVSGVTQMDDGTRTQIDITSFFPRGYAFGQDVAKVSVRPVYAPLPTQFLGRGGVVPTEPFDLLLFGLTNAAGDLLPGKTLRPSIDYELNLDDGSIEFLNPPQGPLLPTQSLFLRHTRQRTIAPILFDEFVLNPRYIARFVYITAPSEENNRLGKILRATYTFANPDTFFYRTLPLLTYLGEVAEEVAQEIAAQLPSFGPAPAVIPPVANANQGRLGLKSQLRDLDDTDRAARVFLEFYNEAIVAFEQVLETITGNIVGERDGKFQFFVGKGKEVPPPGYEDGITGELNPRNLFSEVFFGYNPKVTFLTRDPLVDPTNFTVDDDQLEGAYIDPDFLADLQSLQREFAMNDVDDIVLYARTRKRLRLFPLRLEAFGKYRRLGEPSRFSRLFPELANWFTLTDPGIGADLEVTPVKPGVYAFRKKIKRLSIKGSGGNFKIELPKRASTFFKPIADVGNPVLGQVENIGSITVRNRLPRARIFAYSPVGFPEFDDFLIGVPSFSASPRPAVIATPLPLHELPIGENGLPDVGQLAAQGGEVIDLTTGDPELFTPPFQETNADAGFRPKISFGRPDGRILDVQTSDSFSFEFPTTGDTESFTVGKSVFVGEVLLGCIITFAKDNSSPDDPNIIQSENDLLEVAEDSAAADAPIQLFRGDTIFVTPTDAEIVPAADINEPSKNDEKAAQLQGLPNYRVGFDVGVDRPDGELRDITFPSFTDPSIIGLKEILGQHPPLPLSNVEGFVTFRNGRTEPAPIPALLGGFTNDSGDYSLPYLYAQNTEIDQLGIVAGAFSNVFADSLVPNAVYPDEIQGDDGVILGVLSGNSPPAALVTSLDALPVTTAGVYTPNSGIGDVAPFDVLLIETGQGGAGLPGGSMGILSVGHVDTISSSSIEPPRFVTPTRLGDRLRYTFKSAMSFVNQQVIALPPGMVVRRVGTVTQFDITQISTAILVWNDGTPAIIAGGLNNIFNVNGSNNDNAITINIFTAPDLVNPTPTFLQSVTIDMGNGVATATGDAGAQAIVTVNCDDNIIYVDTPGGPFVTIAPNPGHVPPTLPEDPLNPGDTISLWFTVDIDTSSQAGAFEGQSLTALIQEDRLTFQEGIDLRTVLPRTEPVVDGFPVASELNITTVESTTTIVNTVNEATEVNGGLPFTFLARTSSFPFVGTFDPAPAGSGNGTVRVMGWEGHGNVPITTTEPIVFSAIPSSAFPEGSATVIAEGSGITGVAVDRNYRISSDGVTVFLASAGDIEGIVPGDVVFITGSNTAQAATTAGTYLVKHAIESNNTLITLTTRRELVLETRTLPFNTGRGWAFVDFPTLVSADVDADNEVTLSTTVLSSDGLTTAWAGAGTLYFIVQPDPEGVGYAEQNLKIDYTAVNNITNVFSVNPLTAESFDGVTLTGAAAVAAIDALPANTIVTGFYRFDVRMEATGYRLADSAPFEEQFEETLYRNTVGSASGTSTAGGFLYVTIEGKGGLPTVFTFAGAPGIVLGAPAADELGITVATPIANTSFVNDENAYVYDDVPQYVEMNLSVATWNSIHAAAAVGVFALLPGDTLTTYDAAAVNPNGFWAQAGIFFEPSWPKPTLDLSGANERVVDAGNSVAATEIGFRDAATYGEAATEPVSWQARRIRRFHDVLTEVGQLLGPLRYVYEIRTGVVSTFGVFPVGPDLFPYPYVVTAAAGTNLGPFNDDLVNVNPGDFFRLLDDDGVTLLDEVEIAGIESGTQIWLKEPGITAIPATQVPGKPFQIFLRQVPIPHEQSNEQLLSLITSQVVFDRTANLSTQQGGIVPAEMTPTDPRRLQDTDSSINFAALGVQEGDIVIIDPAGNLSGPGGALPATGLERGTRPFGDRSVPGRTVATPGQEVPFSAGGPSELDDNRGWYRVTAVTGSDVTVSSETEFSNDPGGGFVTFGVEAEYAVYPTISGSTAPFADPPGGPGVEGQMDLRPTAFAGDNGSPPNSFLGNQLSIAPFSYRIIRPNNLFSEEAVDLVLLMRERTLSFLEEFGVFFREDKFGSYFVFQRDQHIADLGNPLIPDEGKGVMSNELIDGVRGLVNISPFANTTDALAVLDRRFWVLDARLDSEFPPNAPPGTPSYSTLETNVNNPAAEEGDGRPVLNDRIDDVLDNNDQFRELRLAWLDFRVNREDGTLVQIQRFLAELPKKRREEFRQLRLAQSIEEAGE